MKIAYIISAYKYPEQLIRLIDRLNTERTHFFVHLDKKMDDRIYFHLVERLQHFPNVCLLERHKCYWGDFGHVKASIKGIEEIFKNNIPFDYAVLLTGQDYPIKSNSQIEAFFKQNERKSFMEYFALPFEKWPKTGGLDRIENWHFILFNKHLSVPIKRSFPKGLQPFAGSSYWCLSRECVEYIHDFISNNNDYVKYFKYVFISDEIFFHTILLNSPFKDTIINDSLRYIKWPTKAASRREMCSPRILGKNDLEDIAKSPKLFARKFDLTKDAEVLDLIDQKILSVNSYVGYKT
ncbi:MAG: beta-1,6-N-acetylglucosaminyltransferase [Phormidium sp.]